MSLDITFERALLPEQIKSETSIEIKFVNERYWLCKNNTTLLVTFDFFIDDNDNKQEIITGFSRYGENDLTEILDEIVLTFQTRFITDNELEMYFNDDTLDVDKMYNDVTERFGYKIENGMISK